MTDPRVAKAEAIATAAHAGQVDKLGVPYMEHVRAVADAVAAHGADFEIVGLLHDAVEDCADESIVSLGIIEDRFGPAIAKAVAAMTKQEGEDYQNDYLPRLSADPLARVIKRADLAHNMSRLHLLPPEVQSRLRAKYEMALTVLDR